MAGGSALRHQRLSTRNCFAGGSKQTSSESSAPNRSRTRPGLTCTRCLVARTQLQFQLSSWKSSVRQFLLRRLQLILPSGPNRTSSSRYHHRTTSVPEARVRVRFRANSGSLQGFLPGPEWLGASRFCCQSSVST